MNLITPREYLQRTGATYEELADRCMVEYHTVRRWFCQGKQHRNPSVTVCRLLALELELQELKAGHDR